MSNTYLSGVAKLNSGVIDWTVTDIRVALVTSSYTFDEAHDDMADITNECTNPGYARKALAGRAVTEDLANHRNKLDATDLVFAALGAGSLPAAAIVYVYNAVDANAQLIAYVPLTTTAPNGADFTIVWGANGVLTAGN